MASQYAHPDVLVETDWVAAHGKDAGIRLVEVDVDTAAYDQGHIEGAVGWNWQRQFHASGSMRTGNPAAGRGSAHNSDGPGGRTLVRRYTFS